MSASGQLAGTLFATARGMSKASAGIVLFRRGGGLEVLLVHPGGPLWAGKDEGAWSIPKGAIGNGEDPLEAALREFEEETGARPNGAPIELGSVKLASGKVVLAWAIEQDFDPARLLSNTFVLEWPPRSGRRGLFPEVDRAEWFAPAEAERRILASQVPFITRLVGLERGLLTGLRPPKEAAMPTTPQRRPERPGPTGKGREARNS